VLLLDPQVGNSVVGPRILQHYENFFGIAVLQFVGCPPGSSMAELIVTSSKTTYAKKCGMWSDMQMTLIAENGIKDLLKMALPLEQDPVLSIDSPSHQEACTSLLSSSIREKTECSTIVHIYCNIVHIYSTYLL